MQELEFVRFTNGKSYTYIKKDNTDLILSKKTALVNSYIEMAASVVNGRESWVRAFTTKTCLHCQSPLRWISGYNFYGCPKYKDGKKHRSISDTDNEDSHGFYIDKNWLTNILEEHDLRGIVTAKELFAFYRSEGLNDLRSDFNNDSSEKMLNCLTDANARSKVQESEALELLTELFDKIIPQQRIEYKYKGAKKKFCIPDFICSNKDFVSIVDAKLDYPDDDKMDLYMSLVRFAMNERGDKRKLTGGHIMYYDTLKQLLTQRANDSYLRHKPLSRYSLIEL